MIASKLQWYDDRVSATVDENDVIANMLAREPDGSITIFEYATPKAAEQAFDSTAQGHTTAFKGYPARQVDRFGSSYFMWQDDGLIYSISRTNGDPKEWAELVTASLEEMLNPETFVPPEVKKPAATPTATQTTATRFENLSLSDNTLSGNALIPGQPADAVVMIELEHLRSGDIIGRLPVIVPTDGGAAFRFKAPIMGWPSGTYQLTVTEQQQELGTQQITIKDGRLLNE